MVAYPTGFTTLNISNMALSAIGARSTIANLNENSTEGAACKLWYDFSRLQTLAAFDWAFARKRVALTLSTEDPPTDVWLYRYIIPSDCVAIRYLWNPAGPSADAVPFTTELAADGTRTLLSNLEDAIVIYTSNVSSINLFTPFFIDALATYLAFRIAVTITGDLNIRGAMAQQFVQMMRVAPAQDANESVDPAPREAEAIRART